MAIIIYHYYICVLVDLLNYNRTVRRCYTGCLRTALNLVYFVAYLAFLCLRSRASHTPGGILCLRISLNFTPGGETFP